MAKGKKKKGKKERRDTLKPKEYPLMTLEELRAREARHYERLADLKSVVHFLKVAFNEVEQYEDEMRVQEKWEKYVNCVGLPKPYSPPEVGLFFVKLRHFEEKSVMKTIDWQLSVNESSILSQDIFRIDLTRKTLVKEIRPNIGLEYDQNIEVSLKVLKDIEYFLDDRNIIEIIPERILDDIIEQKTKVHQEIGQFFDRFAYRILCSEDAYMDQIDAISTEYSYEAKNFEIQIWALKNVPILFHNMEIPSLIANLRTLKLELQIPFSVLQENLTIRGIHMNFDHYSEHAKSFEQKIDVPVGQVHGGITDLYQSLTIEWAMQLQRMQEVRESMIKARLEFEQRQRQIAEEAAKKAKERKAADRGKTTKKKKEKPKKKVPEPPIITDDVFPDVWNDFLEVDAKHNEDFINAVFHPDNLKLTEQEINLKKYMILGGIYQLYVVTKPDQTNFNFNAFTMTWHANNGNLHVDKDFVTNLHPKFKEAEKQTTISRRRTKPDFKETNSKRRTQEEILSEISRISRSFVLEQEPQQQTESKSKLGAFHLLSGDEKYTKDTESSPLFIITFELPSCMCLWGEPIPCHFEADVIGLVEAADVRLPSFMLSDPTEASTSVATSEGEHSSVLSALATPRDLKNDLAQAQSNIDLNLYRTISTFDLHKGKTVEQRELPPIDDFDLNLPMTKQQIRKLQRYCVPRMISSYRFPVEIAEEETEESRSKPKGEAGTLIRKRMSESEEKVLKTLERIFAFDNQSNPERIFPIFNKKEVLFSPPKNVDYQLVLAKLEPETFYELIESLDFVKKKYKTHYRELMDVPQIIQKSQVHKKLVRPTTGRRNTLLYSVQPRRSLLLTTSKVGIEEKLEERDKSIEEREKSKGRMSGRRSPRTSARHSARRSRRETSKVHRLSSSKKSKKSKDRQKGKEVPDTKTRETKLEKYSHWTRAHIYHWIFDRESRKVTIWTDRLGTIGFAYKRYLHFPFRYWFIEPSEENPDTEIVVTIDSQYARCIIYVTAEGFRGVGTEITLKYKKNKEIYMEIKEPLKDLKELKKVSYEHIFISELLKNMVLYVGYFSEKHLATELHTYSCMAIHANSMRFEFSNWNRLADRRDIVLRLRHYKDPEEQLTLTRITPEGTTFVEVKELCTDNLDEFKLDYALTWRNIDHYADLHHCVTSMYPAATETRIKNANLITNLKNLLLEIRPLSYS